MSEYWTEKDVMENAILDLQHERDDLQADLARRDDIIARLKKDSDRLFVFAQHIPSCSGTCASGGFCACGLDKVITLHRALIAELEKETEK